MDLRAAVVAAAVGSAIGGIPPTPDVAVTATIDPRIARIGDRVAVAIVVEGGPDVLGAAPVVGPAIGPFETIAIEQAFERHGSRWRATWTIVLTTFTHGSLTLPAIEVRRKGSGSPAAAATTPLGIVIAPAAAGADDPLRPLTSVMEAPSPKEGWMRILRSTLAAVAGTAGVLQSAPRMARWRRQRAAWKALLAEAAALSRAGQDVPPRDQYTHASRLLRRGIAPVSDRRTEPLSSAELAALVGASGSVGAEIGPALSMLMAHLDAVRFGGGNPPLKTRKRAADAVLTLLHALRAASKRRTWRVP